MSKKNLSTIIEITDQHIKIVQGRLQARGQMVVHHFDIRPFKADNDETIQRLLADMTATLSISTDLCKFIIPRRKIILKTFKLPAINDNEIKKMLDLQVVQKVPYDREEIDFEHQVLVKDQDGYSTVLAFIVHKEVVQRYMQILSKAGITPNTMMISSFGLLQWFNYFETHDKSAVSNTVLVIDIDRSQSEICFIYDKNIIFSRMINFGVKDLESDNLFGFLDEIELSVGVYRKEEIGPDIEKIFFISSVAVNSLIEKVEQNLKISCRQVASFDHFLAIKKVSFVKIREELGVSIATSFGAVCKAIRRSPNFLPKEINTNKIIKKKRLQFVQVSLLLIIVLAMGFSIFGIELYYKTEQANQIELQLEKLERKFSEAEQKEKLIATLKEQFKTRSFLPNTVYELLSFVPAEVSFRSVSIDDEDKITIDGYAETGSSVTVLQNKLVQSRFFEEVNLQFATKRNIFRTEVTDFKMTFIIANQHQPEQETDA